MYKNVMWATDGSEAADRALAHAKALATESGGQLTVVYCEEFTLPGKGGGSLPLHANEDDVAGEDRSSGRRAREQRHRRDAAEDPQPGRRTPLTRSPNSRPKITPT